MGLSSHKLQLAYDTSAAPSAAKLAALAAFQQLHGSCCRQVRMTCSNSSRVTGWRCHELTSRHLSSSRMYAAGTATLSGHGIGTACNNKHLPQDLA